MRRVRSIKECAENPEQLQCKRFRLCFRVPVRVRLCLIIGTSKAVYPALDARRCECSTGSGTEPGEHMDVPQFTLDDYERVFADRHLLHGVLAKWAKTHPEAPAILSAEGDRAVTWSEFDRLTTAMARELLRRGFVKGDFLVTLLPFTADHVLLEYSCRSEE